MAHMLMVVMAILTTMVVVATKVVEVVATMVVVAILQPSITTMVITIRMPVEARVQALRLTAVA